MKRFLVLALFLSISGSAVAFDEDVERSVAIEKHLVDWSNKVADRVNMTNYGICLNFYLGAQAFWVQHPVSKDNQYVYAILGAGLANFRQKFFLETGTVTPLDISVEKTGGAYFHANGPVIRRNCTDLVINAKP